MLIRKGLLLLVATTSILFSDAKLPPLETEKVQNVTAPAVSVKPKENNLIGTSFLDICDIEKGKVSNYGKLDFHDLANKHKNGDKVTKSCKEYYSKATDSNLFVLDEWNDIPPFVIPLPEGGKLIKFTTKIKVPQEIIREDKIFIASDSFYGEKMGNLELTTNTYSFRIPYIFAVNGKFLDGNNHLVTLNGKDYIDLELYGLFYTQEQQISFNNVMKKISENHKKFISAANGLLKFELKLQENKRGAKEFQVLTAKDIFQTE